MRKLNYILLTLLLIVTIVTIGVPSPVYATTLDLAIGKREPSVGTYTADAGTNATTIVDAALVSTADDFYNGYLVYNSTRVLWGTVSDYVGLTKTITCSSIAAQTAGDAYYLIKGEGSYIDGTTYVGGALDYTNLTDWNDATYLRANGGVVCGGYWCSHHSYCMENFVTPYASINGVTMTFRVCGGGYLIPVTPYVRISGTNYYGTARTIDVPTTYTENTFGGVTNKNPATGLDWDSTALNAAEFGVKLQLFYYGTYWFSYCSDFKITVDYTALGAPTVATSAASGIEYVGASHNATLNGEVTDDGGGTIDYYGFVWDTSDKGDPGNADPSLPPGAWSSGWKSGAGDYGENPFNHQITGLIINTTYYFRAAAHNASGWSYGAAVSFRTLTNPSITTLAASNIATTTARLNASVTDDGKLGGGASCNVTFIYKSNAGAHYANYAAILAAGGTEVTAAGTYNTGGLPYYDISGLPVSSNIDFSVKITNSVSTQYGGVLYFTTESSVFAPTNFTAIPTSTTISLSWVKGVGASNTFIRYDTATYPTLITDGLATIYAGTGSSFLMNNLIPGQNYYFRAWGLTAGVYSASSANVMATCLAEGAAGVPTLPSPNTPGSWSLTPSTTAIVNLPFFDFANFFAESFEIPPATMWYGLFIVFSVGAGLFVYWRGNNNLLAAMFTCAAGLALGSIMGLVYLWILVFFLMAGIAMAWLQQRYS